MNMTSMAEGEGGAAGVPRTFELDLESTVKLTVPEAGFVSCPVEEGGRSFQAEGTECEIGPWQVNEVFRRCEKPSTVGGRGRREGLCGWKAGHTRRAERGLGDYGCLRGKGPTAPSGRRGPSRAWDLRPSIRLTRCGFLGPAPNQGVGISREICILTTAPQVFLGKRNGQIGRANV